MYNNGNTSNAQIIYGSNSNGDFTKFPDGTLECKKELTAAEVNAIPTGWGGVSYAYPAEFLSAPAINHALFNGYVNNTQGYATMDNVYCRSMSNSWNLRAKIASDGDDWDKLSLTAIGRWK
jgi:hypothetical protein